MSKINPIIVSLVGLIIGGFSTYLVYIKEIQQFFLFMFAGIVMFAYGFISYLILRSKKRAKEQNPKIGYKNISQDHPLSKWLMRCPYCNANIPNNSIFCPYCGRKLR
jgi:sulfite exporter TauE/SafE